MKLVERHSNTTDSGILLHIEQISHNASWCHESDGNYDVDQDTQEAEHRLFLQQLCELYSGEHLYNRRVLAAIFSQWYGCVEDMYQVLHHKWVCTQSLHDMLQQCHM